MTNRRHHRWIDVAFCLVAAAVLVAACSTSDSATDQPGESTDLPSESSVTESTSGSSGEIASALRGDRDNPDFPDPVVEIAHIVSGGPPPDGIPPLDGPTFESIDDTVLNDNAGVIAVEVDGEAKAYPVEILIWHEIVNDEIGGVPVTVTYCPLCNSALAFDRRFDDPDQGEVVLDFGTSGELYQSALVMYDRQTESLWAHFTGQAIVGHYAGLELKRIPAQTLSWAQFKETYPEGVVLSRFTGFERDYGRNPYVGYDSDDSEPIDQFISRPFDRSNRSLDRIVGIEGDAGPIAVFQEILSETPSLLVDDGDRSLVIFWIEGLASALEEGEIDGGRDVGQTGVFVAADPGGNPLTFTSASAGEFSDDETGSIWDITGTAVSGPLEGVSLTAVPHLNTFWFAWATYRPDGTVIGGESS